MLAVGQGYIIGAIIALILMFSVSSGGAPVLLLAMSFFFSPFFVPFLLILLLLIWGVMAANGYGLQAIGMFLAFVTVPFAAIGISHYAQQNSQSRMESTIARISTAAFPQLPAGIKTVAIDQGFMDGFVYDGQCTSLCRWVLMSGDVRVEMSRSGLNIHDVYMVLNDSVRCQKDENILSFLDFVSDGYVGFCAILDKRGPLPDAIILTSGEMRSLPDLKEWHISGPSTKALQVFLRKDGKTTRLAVIDQSKPGAPNDEEALSKSVGHDIRHPPALSVDRALELFAVLEPFELTERTSLEALSAERSIFLRLTEGAQGAFLKRILASSNLQLRYGALRLLSRQNHNYIAAQNDPEIIAGADIVAFEALDSSLLWAQVAALTYLSERKPAPAVTTTVVNFILTRLSQVMAKTHLRPIETLNYLAKAGGPFGADARAQAMAWLTHTPQEEQSIQGDLRQLMIIIVLAGNIDESLQLKDLVLGKKIAEFVPSIESYCETTDLLRMYSSAGSALFTESDTGNLSNVMAGMPFDELVYFSDRLGRCFAGRNEMNSNERVAPAIIAALDRKRQQGGISSLQQAQLGELTDRFKRILKSSK